MSLVYEKAFHFLNADDKYFKVVNPVPVKPLIEGGVPAGLNVQLIAFNPALTLAL